MSQITAYDSTACGYVLGLGDSTRQAVRVNQVGPVNVTLLPSAARASNVAQYSADQTNAGYKGAIFYLSITAASGTGGLKFALQFKDPVSGLYVPVYGPGPTTALTAVNPNDGPYVFAMLPFYPNTAGINPNGGALMNGQLPSLWRAYVIGADSSSYTYSLSADLIP